MAIAVNPPRQKIPRKILDDPELRDFFVEQQEFNFKMWLRSGGGQDLIGQDSASIAMGAQISTLQQQVGTGDDLTFDDDGFTWDADVFSWDQDEA